MDHEVNLVRLREELESVTLVAEEHHVIDADARLLRCNA